MEPHAGTDYVTAPYLIVNSEARFLLQLQRYRDGMGKVSPSTHLCLPANLTQHVKGAQV